MDLGLKDRRCLVTGASGGIGRAIALALAREGAHLAITARSPEGLETLSEEIVCVGGVRPLIFVRDLSISADHDSLAKSILKAFGRLDILVNNAGGSRPISDIEGESAWEESFTLNFDAARRLMAAFAPGMKAAGYGRIVNLTGAIVGKALNAGGPAKAALESLSKAMAADLAPHGITVNCVAPGRINSVQILTKLHPTEESRQAFIKSNIPMGRFGEPEELAAVVIFLVSSQASYITGTTIPVDGGALRFAF